MTNSPDLLHHIWAELNALKERLPPERISAIELERAEAAEAAREAVFRVKAGRVWDRLADNSRRNGA